MAPRTDFPRFPRVNSLPPPLLRQRHATLARRLRGRQRFGPRRWRVELRQDRLQPLDLRRQREAVALDRFAEQLGQDRFVAVVKFRHDPIMRRKRRDGDTAPLTLGQALTAQVRLIVWCKACGHRAEPDIAEQVAHHGSGYDRNRLGSAATVPGLRRAIGRFRRQRRANLATGLSPATLAGIQPPF